MSPKAMLRIALIAVALTGCESTNASEVSLVLAGDGAQFGMALDHVGRDRSFLIGSIPLCLSGEERPKRQVARLVSVRPADATGGLSVDAFTVREHLLSAGAPSFTGTEEGSLPAPRDTRVSAACPADIRARPDRVFELVIEASKTADGAASTAGLNIEYMLGGQRNELQVPLTLRLCPETSNENGCLNAGADPAS
jgi:hypothetical protein